MKNPISSWRTRRKKRRRAERDLRKLSSVLGGGIRSPVYVGDRTVFAPTHFDQWMYVATEDASVCPRIIATGNWESGTTNFLQSYIRDGMKYVEVGANYGYFAVQAGALVGIDGRVDAFEPLPRACDLVRRSFLANGAAKLSHLHQCAVSDTEGTATLYNVDGNHGGGQLAPHEARPDRQLSELVVKTTTLDIALGGRRMDFLKMDAQGSEGHVFRGAKSTLEMSPDVIMVIEMCARGWRALGSEPRDVLGDLQSKGFRFWRLDEMTGRAKSITIPELLVRPNEVFDFVCCRKVPPVRPGFPPLFDD